MLHRSSCWLVFAFSALGLSGCKKPVTIEILKDRVGVSHAAAFSDGPNIVEIVFAKDPIPCDDIRRWSSGEVHLQFGRILLDRKWGRTGPMIPGSGDSWQLLDARYNRGSGYEAKFPHRFNLPNDLGLKGGRVTFDMPEGEGVRVTGAIDVRPCGDQPRPAPQPLEVNIGATKVPMSTALLFVDEQGPRVALYASPRYCPEAHIQVQARSELSLVFGLRADPSAVFDVDGAGVVLGLSADRSVASFVVTPTEPLDQGDTVPIAIEGGPFEEVPLVIHGTVNAKRCAKPPP